MSLDAIAEAVRTTEHVQIVGSGSKAAFGLSVDGAPVLTECLQGVICYEPDDRVIEVWAGTKIADLQRVLKDKGQCLPIPEANEFGQLLAGVPGTVGGLISMNLPHGLSAQCGGPKEWVLGAKVMRADGQVVKSGGKVVKNVAGFDFHRFIVGARGSMGLVVSVFLKVLPSKSMPVPSCRPLRNWDGFAPLAVQRVLPSSYAEDEEILGDRLYAVDPASCTLWFEPESEIRRFTHDWVIRANSGAANLAFSQKEAPLFQMAKKAVDPAGKFNPGVLGCL